MTSRLTVFHNDGLTFRVSDTGPLDGPVVALLHGFPQNHHAWDGIAPLLGEAGYRTLAADLRGYSPQARPADAASYRMPSLISDVVAMAEAAEASRFHVVGHDWGGALAWNLAAVHPSRVLTVTSLSTPHPDALHRAMRESTQGLKSSYMMALRLPGVPERLMPRIGPLLQRDLGPEAAQYVGPLATPADWRGPVNWYRANPPSLRHHTPLRCSVNATHVWGSKDPYLGRYAAEHTERYVNADYEFVELDAGHWLPEHRPRECAEAIVRRLHTGL